MKRKSTAGLYLLLIVIAACSMVYFIAGAVALREEFFHAGRYARGPFDLAGDGKTVQAVRPEGKTAGIAEGDVLVALSGAPYTGKKQMHDLLQRAVPGRFVVVSVRASGRTPRTAAIRFAPREGPGWSFWQYLAFLTPILGVPLLGLLIGYWMVVARPTDLNAWLVLFLLAFPETAYGNLDWSFWPSPWYL